MHSYPKGSVAEHERRSERTQFPAHLVLGRVHIDVDVGGKNLDAAHITQSIQKKRLSLLTNVHDNTITYTILQQQHPIAPLHLWFHKPGSKFDT